MSLNIILNAIEPQSGTSTITANLALLAAMSNYRVCVIDTNFEKPRVHSQIGAAADYIDYGFNHYLSGQCSIQQAIYDLTPQIEADIAGRIFLSPANLPFEPDDPSPWNGYDLKMIKKGIASLIETLEIDILFIDTPAGLNEMTLNCIEQCHELVLVTKPGQKTYLDAERTRQPLDQDKISFIINAIDDEGDLAALSTSLENTSSRPVIAALPWVKDIDTVDSKAFVLRHPPHPMTQQLKESVVSLLSRL